MATTWTDVLESLTQVLDTVTDDSVKEGFADAFGQWMEIYGEKAKRSAAPNHCRTIETLEDFAESCEQLEPEHWMDAE